MLPKYKVAIIDSGIEHTHNRFKNINFAAHINFTNGDSTGELTDSHGTGVFDVIRKSLKKNGDINECEFHDLRVFNDLNHIEEAPIISALEYCANNKIDIINMSLGLIADHPSTSLYDVCQKAFQAGCIMVASADNEGNISFPAHFPFVLGVSAGVIDNLQTFGYRNNHPIELIGKGTLQRVAWLNNSFNFKGGTSYATAHMTGTILGIIQKYNTQAFSAIKTHLKKASLPGIDLVSDNLNSKINESNTTRQAIDIDSVVNSYFRQKDHLKWMKKIALYPYSIKEFSNFHRFGDMSPFEIVELIDFPRNILHQRNVTIKEKILRRKCKLNDLTKEYDTLVIGYPQELNASINSRFYKQLIEKNIKDGKNFYVIDQACMSDIKRHLDGNTNKVKIYTPEIDNNDYQALSSLKTLGNVKKPTLCVIGTNSQVGKFTVQLKIKQILEKENYKTGWLSTEPQGELFGADFCFPYGFKSTVRLDTANWMTLLSSIQKGIEISKDPDIIITGHQAGLLPFSFHQMYPINVQSYAFLSGVQPDSVVCAISPHDNIETIRRTVNFIKDVFATSILYFNLSNVDKKVIQVQNSFPIIKTEYLKDDQWNKKASIIQNEFKIPVYNVFHEDDESKILNKIEEFYS